MPDFMQQIRESMRGPRGNYNKLAETTEALNQYVAETQSPMHGLLLAEVAEFLAERPITAMTALRAAVTVHEAAEDAQWAELASGGFQETMGRKIWKPAFDRLQAPNLLNTRKRPDKLDAIHYTQKFTEGKNNGLHDFAKDELKAYLDGQTPQLRKKYIDILGARVSADLDGSVPLPLTAAPDAALAEPTPPINMAELEQFAADFEIWKRNQPPPPPLASSKKR